MALEFSANIERWPLERLIPHARNARTHSEEQVAQIAGSIAEFGFVNPILVGDDGLMVAGPVPYGVGSDLYGARAVRTQAAAAPTRAARDS